MNEIRLNGSVRSLAQFAGIKLMNKQLTSRHQTTRSGLLLKKTVKTLTTDNRRAFWTDYIKPLVQQGNFLKIIELEQCGI